jgi:hypothetical protein
MVISMVKPKWTLQLRLKIFYSDPRMRRYQTLAPFWVHHTVSTLKGRANKDIKKDYN